MPPGKPGIQRYSVKIKANIMKEPYSSIKLITFSILITFIFYAKTAEKYFDHFSVALILIDALIRLFD